jgi:hypothetical protein
MTTPWDDQTLVRIDDAYDLDRASDGVSRFGEYLRLNGGLFRDSWSDEPGPVQDPVEFAAHAWQVATGPIMVPGYVHVRPDLNGITLHRDEDDGALYADIRVPLRHDHIGGGARRFPYGWQDWETDRSPWAESEYRGSMEPAGTKRPSVLASAVIRVPCRDWEDQLAKPTAYEGRTLVTEAKQTVRTIVQHLNVDAAPIVARLLGS